MTPIRIPAIAYTDKELDLHQRIMLRREGQPGASLSGMVFTGALVAFLGGILALASGVVASRNGGVVAVLVFGGFWMGAWAPNIWAHRQRRKLRERRRAALRARMHDASILVTSQGVFTRAATARGFYARSGFIAATLESGLVLLWASPVSSIAIPARLLTPAQQTQLLSFGQAAS